MIVTPGRRSITQSTICAIRERTNFQRTYDLAERVIPEELRRRPLPTADGLEALLLADPEAIRIVEGVIWPASSSVARAMTRAAAPAAQPRARGTPAATLAMGGGTGSRSHSAIRR